LLYETQTARCFLGYNGHLHAHGGATGLAIIAMAKALFGALRPLMYLAVAPAPSSW